MRYKVGIKSYLAETNGGWQFDTEIEAIKKTDKMNKGGDAYAYMPLDVDAIIENVNYCSGCNMKIEQKYEYCYECNRANYSSHN